MIFDYPDDSIFRIEHSKCIRSMRDVKSCEAIILRNDKDLIFIEAKSSSPYNKEKLDSYLSDIRKKFVDSLIYFFSVRNGRQPSEAETEIPKLLHDCKLKDVRIQFFLIVHGNRQEWMPGLQNAFQECLRDLIGIIPLQFRDVKALNEVGAKSLGIISGYK